MDYTELVEASRLCARGYNGACDGCVFCGKSDDKEGDCYQQLHKAAADAIEELQGELQALKDDTDMAIVEDGKTTRLCFVKKWIPVTKQLPNCNGCYLVWRPHFFGGEVGMPSICYFDGSNTWHDSYGVDFERILHPEDVTHWMPLPEKPEVM